MIRAILTYIQKKAAKSGNSFVQYLACCCACCFWCLENCIRFINKNAYVQVKTHMTPASRCPERLHDFADILSPRHV